MKSISRRQLRSREALWEGSRRQSRGAMDKKAIQGLASGASGHNAAKPSGLGRRVDGTFARWKLVFLSGEISLSCVRPLAGCDCVGNNAGDCGEVSRGHSSGMRRAGSSCRRVTRPVKTPKLACSEGLNRNDKFEPVCSQHGYLPTGRACSGARRKPRMQEKRGVNCPSCLHNPTTVRLRFGTAQCGSAR